jgi:hypothetical protein
MVNPDRWLHWGRQRRSAGTRARGPSSLWTVYQEENIDFPSLFGSRIDPGIRWHAESLAQIFENQSLAARSLPLKQYRASYALTSTPILILRKQREFVLKHCSSITVALSFFQDDR